MADKKKRGASLEELRQAQTEVEVKYGDILNLPHPISTKHRQMTMEERAAQFSPFAALSGYEDAVNETGRLTQERVLLDEDRKEEINKRLNLLVEQVSMHPKVKIRVFEEDEKKPGGNYRVIAGEVEKIKLYERRIVMRDGSLIKIDDIYGIDDE
ncbi:hypothetical protein [Eubacterium oxidoreducens]|uniref:YolD-like protein n=1 Tax=Eubacterium oxidoreducens TaxID=1732 RepID=A0A1G6BL02_EUBOX|nr:hypothetical protein [Eubacterium oxidoreducens]SDB21257.1 hypothetical protein SAMN02910417_01585 [Eubacterium oxidoreducens]